MAGASDYMVGNAPQGASYAAPLIGFMLGDRIAGLPQQYFQGTQNARTLAMQNAYPNGMPMTTDPNTGQQVVDINKVMNTGARLGGQEFVQQQLPLVYGMQADQNVANALAGRGPSAGRAGNPAAAGPANVTPPSPQRGPSPAPAASGFSNAPATLPGIIGEFTAGRDLSPDIVDKIARRLNLPASGVLSPQDSSRARAFLSQVALPPAQNRWGQAQTDASEGQLTSAGGSPPFAPDTGVSQGPSGSPGPESAQQPQSRGAPADPTLNGLIPRSVIARGLTASDFRDQLSALAANRFMAPQARTALDAKIKAIDDYLAKTGEQAQESALKNTQLTNLEKDARNPAALEFETAKAAQAKQAEGYQKVQSALQASGTAAANGQQILDLGARFLDDPGFYSDPRETQNLMYQRVLAALGVDPGTALPQEAFRKLMAKQILDQVNDLKTSAEIGSGSSRIFQQQIELMEKAAASPENTVAANRLLVEIGLRTSQRTQQIADLAANYNGGYLNPQFDVMLRKWIGANPLFTKEEIADPRRISPPLVHSPADLQRIHWQEGMPFRVPAPTRENPNATRILTHPAQMGISP